MREMFEPPAFFEDARRPLHRARSTATTSRVSRRPCATRPRSTARSWCTSSRRRAAATPAENDPIKHLHDIGPRGPKPGSSSHRGVHRGAHRGGARPGPSSWPSPRPCPTPPACSPSASASSVGSIDVGIAEQHAVTSAAGMADGRARARSWRSTPPSSPGRSTRSPTTSASTACPWCFCLDRAGITGDDGPSHHGVLDMALLTKVPGMTVFAPSSYQELGLMLHDALDLVRGPGRHPLVQDRGAAGRARDEVGSGAPRSQGPDRSRRVLPRRRQAARRRQGGRRRARPPRASRPPSGTSGSVPLDPRDDRRRRAAPAAWSPPRTASARAGSARRSPTPSPSATRTPYPAPGPRLGTPIGLHPPGQAPTSILAELGLDGPGLTGRSPQPRRRPSAERPRSAVEGVLAGVVVGGVDDLGDLGDRLL